MFCTKCGNQIDDKQKFCTKCGAQVYVKKIELQSDVKSLFFVEVDENANSDSDAQLDDVESLIREELGIDSVKKKSERGNKSAMLRQAFRYEVGIGTGTDIKKAKELYYNVGENNVLLALDQSHINSVLPESSYDKVIHPDDKQVDLLVLPYVRDLMLDYSYKVNRAKKNRTLTKEISEEYRRNFVRKMMDIRELHPELFLVNLDEIKTDEEAHAFFDTIKKNAAKRYSIKWLPSLFYFTDYIDDNRIEIPSIYNIEKCSLFTIKEESGKIHDILRRFVLTLLLQLPINTIRLNFVDLQKTFVYENLLGEINPMIYQWNPVTSKEQFHELLDYLKERKVKVLKQYDGNYPQYCNLQRKIPLPYEFVFLFNSSDELRLDVETKDLLEKSFRYGIYFVTFKKNDTLSSFDKKGFIINSVKQEFYTDNKSLPLNSYYIERGLSMQGKGLSNMQLACIEDSNDNMIVSGNRLYDVVFKIPSYCYSNYDLYLQTLEKWKHISSINSNYLTKVVREPITIYKKTFQLLIDANDYVNAIKPPLLEKKFNHCCDTSHIICNNICLIPYYVENQNVEQLGIALAVPYNLCLYYYNYFEDLLFYLNKIGFDSQLSHKISQIIIEQSCKRVNYKSFPVCRHSAQKYCLSIEKEECVSLGDEICIFPNFINRKYIMNFGGKFNHENENDIQLVCKTIQKCEEDIKVIEQELHRFAVSKWGEFYYLKHVTFLEKLDNVLYFEIKKKKLRNKIPILNYNASSSDGIIRSINIGDNNILAKAYQNYVNNAIRQYDVLSDELFVVIGEAENGLKIEFRLDLVNHVHSFIIGQSGSGKSVLLHNIICGLMLKYAPEDLQLYLFDFKLGGVEFNRYKEFKHVKSLLVDDSDPLVTLEILRELRNNMVERGKLFRSVGVNKIDDYNQLHGEKKMPHIIVVADECHEMFRADDSIPRQVRNEISDIVIKIAKEGRNQGVHLVFATQTLSGTEISNEIINNVGDFYLLKCAQSDSERLVSNSSSITSGLTTGHIYYHHVDRQVVFQSYYTNKKDAELMMKTILEKAKDHISFDQFYFNGAQMYFFVDVIKQHNGATKGKQLLGFVGKVIDISQKDLYIKLNNDFSENVLLVGLNYQEQVTRTSINLFISLMLSAKCNQKDIAFKVIDCLNNEEGDVHELIYDLEKAGFCEVIKRQQRSKFIKELSQSILEREVDETILLILGQDHFRELKLNIELEDKGFEIPDDKDMMCLSDSFFGKRNGSSSVIRTYRDALNVILDSGPDCGVHTLIQLEKASNLLFEDYITPKMVFQKFKHLILLKSDETTGVTLHLNDDIRLEKLSDDLERLRAYYYAEESDSYTLFTPYMPIKSNDIINF